MMKTLVMPRHAAGFTLIEIVVTTIIAAIMAIGIINYIGNSVDGFSATGNRNQLASSGRTILDRLALELHNAVPNSIRVTSAELNGDQCLEFVPFIGATTYIDPPFTGQGDDVFEVINFNPLVYRESPAELYAVIYPINTEALYDELSTPGPIALIDKIRGTYNPVDVPDPCTDDDISMEVPTNEGLTTICLNADHRFERRSPIQRVFLAEQPVSFCVVDDKIYRYQNYDFQETQCVPDDVGCLPETSVDGRHLVTDRIDNENLEAFSVSPPTLRRNAVISINLNFTDQGDGIALNHEVAMRNVP